MTALGKYGKAHKVYKHQKIDVRAGGENNCRLFNIHVRCKIKFLA